MPEKAVLLTVSGTRPPHARTHALTSGISQATITASSHDKTTGRRSPGPVSRNTHAMGNQKRRRPQCAHLRTSPPGTRLTAHVRLTRR
eukprot:1943230-Prymnesium_polylepis.1